MLLSARTVVLLGIAVQIAAFVRTAIIAARLGASFEVDVYNLGLIVPTFAATVIGSWLQVGFIGRYAGLIATGNHQEAGAYRTTMLVVVGATAALLGILCFWFPAEIMGVLVPDNQPETLASSVVALRLVGWMLVPTIIADFLGLILNSHGYFFGAAFAPLANAAVSVVVLWFWPSTDVDALIWTLLIGAAVQLVVVVVALSRLKLRYPFDFGMAKRELRLTFLVGLAILPAMMLSNSASAIIQYHAAGFGEGAVATFGYASRFHTAVSQILVIGFGTVLLPHLAALWFRGEKDEIAGLFRRLARAAVLISAYLGLGIWLLGETAVGAVLGRGAFDAEHVRDVSYLWAVLALSLFPFAYGTFIAKLAQAVRSGVVIFFSSAVSFVALLLTTSAGAAADSLPLVVGAMVVSASVVTIYWFVWLGRQVQTAPILSDLPTTLLRTVIVLAPAAGLVYALAPLVMGLPDIVDVLIRGTAFSLAAGAVLVLTGWHKWFLHRPSAPVGTGSVVVTSLEGPPL